ncbi:MAG TPA: hypothetical protein VFT06_15650 [Flavisolibacter sp.]|nr:hypothetical protein [Flavisolibacter sp.]
MKTMLLTATAVGSAIAGLILYYQKKNKSSNKLLDAAKGSNGAINNGLGQLERPAQHAMG